MTLSQALLRAEQERLLRQASLLLGLRREARPGLWLVAGVLEQPQQPLGVERM